jgi:hypothetical protein
MASPVGLASSALTHSPHVFLEDATARTAALHAGQVGAQLTGEATHSRAGVGWFSGFEFDMGADRVGPVLGRDVGGDFRGQMRRRRDADSLSRGRERAGVRGIASLVAHG